MKYTLLVFRLLSFIELSPPSPFGMFFRFIVSLSIFILGVLNFALPVSFSSFFPVVYVIGL
jgi:hypothetical protein